MHRAWLLLLVPVALLAASEIGLRMLIGSDSTWNVRLGANKRFDPVAGFRLKSDYEMAEGVFTNEHGFLAPRGLEHAEPPDTLRIIYLGDSVSVLPVQAPFPAQVERILAARLPLRIQTLNAAVPGFASPNARALFESEVAEYDADNLVVYLGWNDLGQYGPEGIPYKRQEAGYHLNPIQRLLTHVYTLRLIYVVDHFQRKARTNVDAPLTPEDEQLYAGYYPTHFEENLRAILERARSRYPHVLLMNLASLTSDDPTPAELQRAHFPAGIDNNVRKLEVLVRTYNRVVASVAAEQQVEMLDLHQLFSTHEAREHFTDSCHVDEEGARRIAEAVASWVLRTRAAAPGAPRS